MRGAYYGIPLSNFCRLGGGGGGVGHAALDGSSPAFAEGSFARHASRSSGRRAFLMSVGLLVFGLPWAALAAFRRHEFAVGTLAEWTPGLERQLAMNTRQESSSLQAEHAYL